MPQTYTGPLFVCFWYSFNLNVHIQIVQRQTFALKICCIVWPAPPNNNKVCVSLCLHASARMNACCILPLSSGNTAPLLLLCALNARPCLCNGRSVTHILLASFCPHYLRCLLQQHTRTKHTDILKLWNRLCEDWLSQHASSTFHYECKKSMKCKKKINPKLNCSV